MMVPKRLQRACNKLIKRDSHLFRVDANERALTHKLAEYLQSEFPRWNVDCEYNRNRDMPKRLQLERADVVRLDDDFGQTVFPDIIVHWRGTNNNLLVIESKKSNSPERLLQRDREKLIAYKQELRYRFAALVTFVVQQKNCRIETDWV